VRRGLTLAAAAAATGLLAGCGGGGSDRLSAKDYRAQATAICADTQRATDALGRPKRTSEFKVFLARGLKVTDRSLRRFAALKPPTDLQNEHDAIIAGERRAQDQLRSLSGRLHGDSRDIAVLRRVQPQLSKIGGDTNARYRAAGLTRCAQG
jgi:hypothetical protein